MTNSTVLEFRILRLERQKAAVRKFLDMGFTRSEAVLHFAADNDLTTEEADQRISMLCAIVGAQFKDPKNP
jgi:hypothetical protein